jgi:putative ABC transport system substrate-binding protein
LLYALLVGGLLAPAGADAAREGRLIKIGALTSSWGPTPHMVGLRDGLTELGYRENEDFAIGVRFTQGNTEALFPAARELVENGVDVIFTVNTTATAAAQRATKRIPIVFTSARDPVGMGFIRSFARPGGNLTGLTDLDMELGPKRLELFKKLIPGMKKVLFPYSAYSRQGQSRAETYRKAARRLGIELVERPVRNEQEAKAAFSALRKQRVDGILSARAPDLNLLGLMLKATTRQKIPTMFGAAFMVEDGGFASYGPSWYEAGRQAARMVDKIIKGRKPADIPVEVNTRLVFAVNLKVARALGLKIPPQALYQADRIVR